MYQSMGACGSIGVIDPFQRLLLVVKDYTCKIRSPIKKVPYDSSNLTFEHLVL